MILIVDDKRENLLSLQSLLASQAYAVDTASGGEEALRKVLQQNYGLIILDVQMPEMDGFEVAEMISGYSKTKDVPIIFLSAVSIDKKFITKGYRSGAIDYITKPIDPDIFLLKVNTLYKLYEQKRQLSEMQVQLQHEVEFRKKAQQESQEKAQQLIAILESIPQIAFTTNEEGRIEFFNSHWQSYTNGGARYPDIHPEEPDFPTMMREMTGSKNVFEREVRIRRDSSAEYKYFLLRAVPQARDKEGKHWTGTFTDIDEQKKASQRKDEFISVASHELKTPLTSMKGYIQLLERTMKAECPTRLYVERTLQQIHKLDGLIADLLDISRIESGRMKLNKSDFQFMDIVNRALEQIQQIHPEHALELNGHTDAFVYGDDMRLEQVLLNFLSNAIKYSPQHKKVTVSVSSSAESDLRN